MFYSGNSYGWQQSDGTARTSSTAVHRPGSLAGFAAQLARAGMRFVSAQSLLAGECGRNTNCGEGRVIPDRPSQYSSTTLYQVSYHIQSLFL